MSARHEPDHAHLRRPHELGAQVRRELDRHQLFMATAKPVLQPEAPIGHFAAWLRFFVDEYGARP